MHDQTSMNLVFICDNKRHLVCIPYSTDNLHRMAEALGVKRCWYHPSPYPHYDIPKKRVEEITARCIVVRAQEIVRIVRGKSVSKLSDIF